MFQEKDGVSFTTWDCVCFKSNRLLLWKIDWCCLCVYLSFSKERMVPGFKGEVALEAVGDTKQCIDD
jgi:hypothetical protein